MNIAQKAAAKLRKRPVNKELNTLRQIVNKEISNGHNLSPAAKAVRSLLDQDPLRAEGNQKS